MLNLRRKQSPEYLLHKLLPQLLTKKAPNRIPMTGKAALSNNCYAIYFGNQYLVEAYDQETRILNVCTPDANGAFTINSKVELSEALRYAIHITYFYKNYWQDYTNIQRLARDHRISMDTD